MSVRTSLNRMWDYRLEIVVSTNIFMVVLKLCEVFAYHLDAFTDWEVVQMGMWVFFSLAAIICMYNTAVSRVAVQKAEANERKGGL